MKFFKKSGLQLLVLSLAITIFYISGIGCSQFMQPPYGSTSPPVKQPPVERKTVNYLDGSRYEGPVLNDKPHGNGIMFYSDGRRYSGSFNHGKPYGIGNMFYPDGRIEKGQWWNGQFMTIGKTK